MMCWHGDLKRRVSMGSAVDPIAAEADVIGHVGVDISVRADSQQPTITVDTMRCREVTSF